MQSIYLGSHGPLLLRRPLTITPRQALTHMHVVGVSGSGKSRFLAGLYLELLRAGIAVTLIDPHGDLSTLILKHLVAEGFFDRPESTKKLIYLDIPKAAKAERYLPFNVLKQNQEPDEIGDNIVDAMHRTWPALALGAAPRFDKLVKYGVHVLVCANQPLSRLNDFLTDTDYRAALLTHEKDPDILKFWNNQYEPITKNPRLFWEYTDSTLTRIDLLSYAPIMKHSIGQPETKLPFRELMDRGTSILVNLAIKNLEAKRLLGSLMTMLIEQAAMTREDIPEEKRVPHILMVDEFAEFVQHDGATFAKMLSQTRKYKLWLCMAHQYYKQAEPLLDALQNTGLKVVFEQGAPDAKYTAELLGHYDPKTVRTPEESVGLPDQREEFKQEIQDQWARTATISLKRKHHWWYHVREHPPRRTVKVRTMAVPNPKVDPKKLKMVEDYYLAEYFRAREEAPDARPPQLTAGRRTTRSQPAA